MREKSKSLIRSKRLKGGKRRKKAEKGGKRREKAEKGGKRRKKAEKGEFDLQLDFWQKTTSLVEMS